MHKYAVYNYYQRNTSVESLDSLRRKKSFAKKTKIM